MAKGKKKKAGSTGPKFSPKPKKKKPVIPHIEEAFSTKKKLLIGLAMAILAVAVYFPSYNYDFVYDDDAVVKDNKYVQQGLSGLGKIWTTTYFMGYDENMNARAFRPIPLSTLALEYEIWGLNSTVNHIFNLLFYGLTAVFLFLFLSKLLREHHPIFPIAATLLFLLHPIHVEVVANIKSRDTMLGFLNFCIASWLLLKHLDNRKVLPLIGSLIFYFLALFSKEEVITTVALIPVMLWCFRKLSIGKITRTSLPYFAAAGLFLLAYSSVLFSHGKPVDITYFDNSLLAASSTSERIASNLLVIGHYLSKTVFPHPLISDYAFSTIPLTNWGDWRVYLALVLNVGLFALGIWGVIKKKAWGFALFWYFTAVSIFTSIVTPNVSAYNDRFLYTPVLGICLLASWGISRLVNTSSGSKDLRLFFQKNFAVVAILAILGAVSIVKIESHLPVWKTRFSLFENDVKYAPNNARALKNHGGSLARIALEYQSTSNQKMREYAEKAIEQLEKALAIYPRIPTGHIHKGNMHIMLGQNDEAIASLSEALRLAPNNYFARSSLANVYFRQGRYQESLDMVNSIAPQLRRPSDLQLVERCKQRLGGG